jgi:hypothetical protein
MPDCSAEPNTEGPLQLPVCQCMTFIHEHAATVDRRGQLQWSIRIIGRAQLAACSPVLSVIDFIKSYAIAR